MEIGEKGEVKLDPGFDIEQEWLATIIPLVDPEKHERAEEILQATFAKYAEEDRHYHALEHIAECLEALQLYKERPDYPKLFLALLWHDLVYETDPEKGPQHNEERSANHAAWYMDELGIEGGPDVARLILSTKAHRTDAEDEQLVCAIDLLRLAVPFEQFSEHGEQIRREYWRIDEEVYVQARPAILENLVAGDGPFRHPDFVYLNEAAKANVRAEIQMLTGKG